MKKSIISVLLCASLLLAVAPGAVAADALALSPSAIIDIDADTGYTVGFVGETDADTVLAQFEGDVTLTSPKGEELGGSDKVPSNSTVSSGDAVAKVLIPGDVNCDAKINVTDAISVLKIAAGWEGEFCHAAGDIDGNGKVAVNDAVQILKFVANWDVTLGERVTVTVFEAGVTDYSVYNDADGYGATVAEKLEALTENEIALTDTVGENVIVIGRDLYETYDFIPEDAVKALEDTQAYICMNADNVYLTANSDNGMLGAINYITSQAFTPELDLVIEKGHSGVLGDLETLVTPTFTTVEISGIKNDYRFMHLTDTHITTIYDDEENEERRNNVSSRLNDWIMNMYRKPSYLFFNEYFGYAESVGADAILMTGDITDSPSKSNIDIMKNAIDNCTLPVMYNYGNHDWTWNDNYQKPSYKTEYASRFGSALSKWDDDWSGYVDTVEYEDLIIVSADNSNYSFDGRIYSGLKNAFSHAKEVNKPVVLMLHIPFHTEDLHPVVEAAWPDGGGLCIGRGGNCTLTEVGNRTCDLITGEDSPVALILAGHVHLNFETMVEGRIPQIITSSGLDGGCRIIDLVPAED